MPLTETFGANLRHHRKISSIKQSQLAEQAGLTTEMISQLERGVAAPSFGTIEKLAEILGVPEMLFFSVVGVVALPTSERMRTLQKIHTTLSRMNDAQLNRASKLLTTMME